VWLSIFEVATELIERKKAKLNARQSRWGVSACSILDVSEPPVPAAQTRHELVTGSPTKTKSTNGHGPPKGMVETPIVAQV